MGYDEYNKNPEHNHATMQTEWAALRDIFLQKGAEVKLMQPDKRYPDQVFTADHAFSCAVFKRERDALHLQKAVTILSRLAHPNRGGEMLIYTEFLKSLMLDTEQAYIFDKWELKESASYFEGIGDNVLDAYRGIIVSGFGLRNAETALQALQQITGIPVYGVMCKKPFFHIDTVFAPLPDGYVMYAPDVMHPESVTALEKALFKGHPELKQKYGIQVSKEDAYRFACNVVTIGKSVIMQACSDELKAVLADKGLDVTYTTAKVANYAGGGAHCMSNIFNQPVFV